MYYGINYGMKAIKKITVHVPKELLKQAQEVSGDGVTQTVRQGLELIAAKKTYEKIRQLRGKVRFSIDIKKLREDRS